MNIFLLKKKIWAGDDQQEPLIFICQVAVKQYGVFFTMEKKTHKNRDKQPGVNLIQIVCLHDMIFFFYYVFLFIYLIHVNTPNVRLHLTIGFTGEVTNSLTYIHNSFTTTWLLH